jgi:DNA polymerase elongation subunit (family B)
MCSVHHSLIPRLFAGGPDEVTRLIKYCVTDCVLPLALDDKWQAYAGGVEMARVTGVLHESLISRGQGEKSDSLFIRECAREDLLRPIRTPYSRDDGPQHFFTLDVEDCAWEDENDNDDGEAGEPQKQRQTVYNLRDTEDAMDVDASTLTVRHDIDQRRKRPLDELADQPPAKRQRTTGLSSDASSATAASSANAQPSTAAAAATLEMGRETVSGDASARKRKRPSSDSGEDAFSKPAKLRKVAIGSTYELTEEDRRFGYEHVPDAELARRKQFAGATVKEPDKGFYHENAKDPRFRGCIVTNDFSSLYPSVMIAFNLWQIQNAYMCERSTYRCIAIG